MNYSENIRLAIRSLLDRKMRSFLTMLGIIFGVASVIAMLSVGEGAKREAIAKYQDLGVNNIIIREKKLSEAELEEVRAKFSQGLSIRDANAIAEIVPTVTKIAAQAEIDTEIRYSDKSVKSTLVGITSNYLEMMNYKIGRGELMNDSHHNRKLKVCILGAGVANTLFGYADPIGEMVKVEDQWLEVIGVLESKSLFTETVGELAARDLNTDVYVPISMFLSRFPRKSALTGEIQQITAQVSNSNALMEASKLIDEIIKRHHFNNQDYNIVIPYELLKQEEKERQIYNILLGAIAAISLIVGGIGIMNIMLATVLERTREIGTRRAIGARKSDIMTQFVTEAIAISMVGGMVGVLLGIVLSLSISLFTDITTSIQLYSVFIAFTFSVVVGICFGYMPAKNAANLKPIESMRYE